MTTTTDSLTNEQLAACHDVWLAMGRLGWQHFNMAHWGLHRWEDSMGNFECEEEMQLADMIGKPNDESFWCGTAACLAGTGAVVLSDRLPKLPPISFELCAYDRDEIAREHIADVLGMRVGLPHRDFSLTSWFFSGSWPWWAQQRELHHTARAHAVLDTPNRTDVYRYAEYHTVLEVLDDLVHGRRQHWWDGELLAPHQPDDEEASEF